MILLFLKGEKKGQEQIRKELGENPLAHSSREKWLNVSIPIDGYKWKSKYIESYPLLVQEIEKQLKKQIPVPMSTRLTESGHVILIIGLYKNSNGEFFVTTHDPWGKFNFETFEYELGEQKGKNVEYPLKELYILNKLWKHKNENKTKWSRFIIGKNKWIPSEDELTQQGYDLNETLKDWEFVGIEKN